MFALRISERFRRDDHRNWDFLSIGLLYVLLLTGREKNKKRRIMFKSIRSLAVYVADIERAKKFYTDILGFVVSSEPVLTSVSWSLNLVGFIYTWKVVASRVQLTGKPAA